MPFTSPRRCRASDYRVAKQRIRKTASRLFVPEAHPFEFELFRPGRKVRWRGQEFTVASVLLRHSGVFLYLMETAELISTDDVVPT